ncbi:MAG: hypothetical protein KME47_09765 [Nodosilinea sp. WJT8-NPBG4]|jgi:hypothetical protein|nr:hypothetical protein [Nodosilinea sp. WJT8-NPBG4]
MTESEAHAILSTLGPWNVSISQGLNTLKFEKDHGAVLLQNLNKKEFSFKES